MLLGVWVASEERLPQSAGKDVDGAHLDGFCDVRTGSLQAGIWGLYRGCCRGVSGSTQVGVSVKYNAGTLLR
jgi:hypothetical protein